MQYTSRAPYHGQYNTQKNNDRLNPIFETWRDLSQSTPGSDEHELFTLYQKEGGNDSEEDFKLKWDSGEIEVGNVRELREFKEKLLTLKK